MPIDTALKRRSASGVPHHPLGVGVTPDVLKPVAWRASSAWGYAGIPPSPPTPGGGVFHDKFTLGTKESLGANATQLGGWQGF